jgi:hypothetical protein
VISKTYLGALSPDKWIGEHLVIVLAVYALVILAGRRNWLRGPELMWVGLAMIFWAIAFLLQPIVTIVRIHYGAAGAYIPISAGLIAPLVIAMAFGLRYTMRRVAKQSESPAASLGPPGAGGRGPAKPGR